MGTRGELRIYLGAAPGVGKTYAMLCEAHRRTERGTDVVVVHEGIPDVVPREDNETGTRMALEHLARLVEGKR